MINNKYSFLLKYLRQYQKDILIVFVSLLVVSLVTLNIGNAARNFVDVGLTSHGDLEKSVLYLAFLILLFAIGSFFRVYYIRKTAEKISVNIKQRAYSNILYAEIAYLEELSAGDLLTKLGADVKAVNDLIISFLSFFIRNIVMLVGGVFLMFSVSFKLTLCVLAIVPIILIPLMLLAKRSRNLTTQVLTENSNIASTMEEGLTGIRTINAYNQQQKYLDFFDDKIDRYLTLSRQHLKLRSIFFACAILAIASSIISVVWIGSLDIISGKITSGQMLSFLYFAVIVGVSSGGVVEIISEMQTPLASLQRIYEIVSTKQAEGQNLNYIDFDKAEPSFELKDVSFAYPTAAEKNILSNLTMRVAKPGYYGIAGPSGCGKSTLFALLIKFYYPQTGLIKYRGHDIMLVNNYQLREKISYVQQDSAIFSGTIYSNIKLSSPDADEQEVEYVAKLTGVYEFAQDLPSQLNTDIGQKGVRLSGGQKQRIAIARALLAKPDILLLDEATSSLDNNSQEQITYNILKFMKGKIVISIAHRISTLTSADMIFLVNNGRIEAQGTHMELLKKSSLYISLNKEQKRAL